ncbi:MAG TPA: S8 family peptidase [Flavobacteriales bacterium]|nr:S8 family peptidase [Flavobacteriales bacterium]
MRSRVLLFVLCWSLSQAVEAQGPTKLSFQLQAWLQKADPAGEVDLFLGGEAGEVARAVLRNGGRTKMAIDGWVLATLPVAKVEALDKEPGVQSVVFNLAPGTTLNDSMRVKAHVEPVHQGLAPLRQAYQGQGVLMGIIDTGLELAHPDFLDSLGRTRVLHYWDQNLPFDPWLTPTGYGYGQAWDSAAINAGDCPATDPFNQFGHGTTVAATAAANSNGNGHCAGVAPQADLIIVANAMGHPNWSASVVDAVRYIVDQAAQRDMPVAINLSLGSYFGSHDGLDPAALMIDQLLNAAPGRVLVCAAGNSGSLPAYHLHTDVGADTTFTWFNYNPNSMLNIGAVYFDLWADTTEFSQVRYSVGADKFNGGYAFRGRTPFRNIQGTLGQIVVDTLWSVDGNKLGRVFTQAQLRGGQYHMEVYIPEPDSAAQLRYRFMTTGQGAFDVWSTDAFGTSRMVTAIPDPAIFPDIMHYVLPDNEQSIVDSWACSPHVITVGNYYNQQVYTDVTGVLRNLGNTPGAISANSSRGPSRTGLVKPDVAAPADVTFGAGPLDVMQALLANSPDKMLDSLHMRNGGTSIASPVVAGTAALLLQKCPKATPATVRNAIVATAFADEFTGELPNISFGHGKVNAFDAMLATDPFVPLTLAGPLCEGDSVMVSGPDFMFRYWWNTGLQERDLWTAGGDTLSLIVETPEGCLGWSDTLMLVPSPLPVATVTANGLLLECSPAASYQWYQDSLPVPGGDARTYEAVENGHYFVFVTDSSGCSAFSDTVFVFTVGIAEQRLGDARLWPVPTTDQLHISGLPSAVPVDYAIWEAAGRRVAAGRVSGEHAQVDVHGLAEGVYVLELRGGADSHRLYFIKVH